MLSAARFAESMQVVVRFVCYEICVELVLLPPPHLSFCVIFVPNDKTLCRIQVYTYTVSCSAL